MFGERKSCQRTLDANNDNIWCKIDVCDLKDLGANLWQVGYRALVHCNELSLSISVTSMMYHVCHGWRTLSLEWHISSIVYLFPLRDRLVTSKHFSVIDRTIILTLNQIQNLVKLIKYLVIALNASVLSFVCTFQTINTSSFAPTN